MTGRRGTTLLELLVALVLLGLLVPLATAVLLAISRATERGVGRLGAERDATAVTGLLGHDLRAAAAADLASPGAGTLEYDRPIGEALVCALDAGSPVIRRATWLATRAPQAGRDQLLVLVAAIPARWRREELRDVAAATCPDGGTGLRLVVVAPFDSALVVRVVEPVRLRRYRSGGRDWLGLEPRLGGGTIQPFAGPLRAGGWRLDLGGGELNAAFTGSGGVAAAFRQPLE